MSAPAAAAATNGAEERRGGAGGSGGRPGWMSVPGGPKEPNFQEFLRKLQVLNGDKGKLYDKLDELRGKSSNRSEDPARQAALAEQNAIRQRIGGLRDEQRKERDQARAKREEMQKLRNERRKIEDDLKTLSGEVGLFRDVSDVEAAMDRLLFKMETGGAGDLKSEKLCSKRLSQLENVKTLLERVQPMTEAIETAEEAEAALQMETRDIHLHLDDINKKLGDTLAEKIKHDDKRGTVDEQRQRQQKEREEIITKIRALATKIETLRHEFDSARKAWNEWRDVAKVRYAKEQEEKFKERERRRKEIEEKRRNERKMRRAAKKLNPYAAEIDLCDTLIKTLTDKIEAQEQDRIKAERARKLAEFDPMLAAPKGLAVKVDDEDWLFADRTHQKKGGGKNNSKKNNNGNKSSSSGGPASAASSSATSGPNLADRPVHLAAEKLKSFERVQVSAPQTYGAAKSAIDELKKKKKHYESFKKSLDEVSTGSETDDEGEEGEAPPREGSVQDAAAAAVAAVVAVEGNE